MHWHVWRYDPQYQHITSPFFANDSFTCTSAAWELKFPKSTTDGDGPRRGGSWWRSWWWCPAIQHQIRSFGHHPNSQSALRAPVEGARNMNFGIVDVVGCGPDMWADRCPDDRSKGGIQDNNVMCSPMCRFSWCLECTCVLYFAGEEWIHRYILIDPSISVLQAHFPIVNDQ